MYIHGCAQMLCSCLILSSTVQLSRRSEFLGRFFEFGILKSAADVLGKQQLGLIETITVEIKMEHLRLHWGETLLQK